MAKRKTTEEFKAEVFDLWGEEYEVIGDYINARTPVLLIHKVCGEEYSPIPHKFLSGSRCGKCFSGSQKNSNAWFVGEVKEKVGEEYEFLESYSGYKTKIISKHISCGYSWKVSPLKFLTYGTRCPKCR